ncbi:unnamed protein product [Wuchereria bancrofti]|uniref:Uncharacterized protein n=1 Tax=Wuchereria bancrofti TaxID=6293 RepID=A0A3P7DXN5_WUCBA|nr:unnamed protein product [Wuchereria bancrofti]
MIAKQKRKAGEYTPLVWDETRGKNGIYRAFLSDWDGDCRSSLMYALISAGFKEVMYQAPYFWKYGNDIAEVEYIEVCEVSISKEDIENLLISAFEGGSNYWYMIQDQSDHKKSAVDCLMFGGWVMVDDEMADEPELKKPIKLDWKRLEHGLRLWASDTDLRASFSDLLSGNDDALTADVYLQMCVFGKVIYG